MNTFGYCRVSSAEQNGNRQLDAMAELEIPQCNIFIDKQSGKDFSRPAWVAMMERLQKGDVLYVHSIDRLGRNYNDIQNMWRVLTKEKGIDIVVLDMGLLDTRRAKDLLGNLVSDLVLNIFSYVAHNERDIIRKRQKEGIKAARTRGVHLGRPIKKPPENFAKVVKQWERGEINFNAALAQTGLKQTTFYKLLQEFRKGAKDI